MHGKLILTVALMAATITGIQDSSSRPGKPVVVATVHSTSGLQDAASSKDTFTLDLHKGLGFTEFCEEYTRITGRRVFFDLRRVGTKRISGIGDMTFDIVDAETVFHSIFMMHDMAVISYGPPELRFDLVEDIKTSQSLKQRAQSVALSEVAALARKPGRIISTVVPLSYVPCEKAQRALNNMIQEHRAGFVQPIEEANAVLITNFAPTVHTMVQLIKAMEAAAASESAMNWRKRRSKEFNESGK